MMKLNAEARREKLKEIIEGKGIFNLNKSELGRQFGVSNVTIHRDFQKILGSIPETDVNEIVYEIRNYFRENFAFSRKLTRSNNEHVVSKGIRCLNETIKNFTSFLEAYNLKTAVPSSEDHTISIGIIRGSDELKKNIEFLAKKEELSIFDFLIKIFPDEVSNTNVVKKWMSEEDVLDKVKEE
jgi:hypothetical protein